MGIASRRGPCRTDDHKRPRLYSLAASFCSRPGLRKGAVVKQIDYMSQQDLAEIVERASTVEERLSGDFSPAGGDDAPWWTNGSRRGARPWGRGDWDGLSGGWPGTAWTWRRFAPLGPVRLREGTALPEWSGILRRRSAWTHLSDRRIPRRGVARADGLPGGRRSPSLRGGPRPVRARGPREARQAYSCFRGDAFGSGATALERAPLRSLIPASAELLLTEFETMRAQEQSSWDRLFALAQEPEGRSLYRRLSADWARGTARLFLQYPVLARRLGNISHLWAEANASSWSDWMPTYPSSSASSATTARSLATSSSSNHRCRIRTAACAASWRWMLASGRKLGVQAQGHGDGGSAYHRLLAWLNERARRCLSRCSRCSTAPRTAAGVRGAPAVPGPR